MPGKFDTELYDDDFHFSPSSDWKIVNCALISARAFLLVYLKWNDGDEKKKKTTTTTNLVLVSCEFFLFWSFFQLKISIEFVHKYPLNRSNKRKPLLPLRAIANFDSSKRQMFARIFFLLFVFRCFEFAHNKEEIITVFLCFYVWTRRKKSKTKVFSPPTKAHKKRNWIPKSFLTI